MAARTRKPLDVARDEPQEQGGRINGRQEDPADTRRADNPEPEKRRGCAEAPAERRTRLPVAEPDGRSCRAPTRRRRRPPPQSRRRRLREQQLDKHGRAYATGRRKDAVARVWLKPGSGKIVVNGREQEVYFARPTLRLVINQPFDVAERRGQYDVVATVKGGGLSGQAGAVKHGIAQALTRFEPALRTAVKRAGFLTRDRASSSARSTAAPRPAAASSSRSARAPNDFQRGGPDASGPPFFVLG